MSQRLSEERWQRSAGRRRAPNPSCRLRGPRTASNVPDATADRVREDVLSVLSEDER
jgi:hypothetical protein